MLERKLWGGSMIWGENLSGESFSLKPHEIWGEGERQIEWKETWSIWVLRRNIIMLAKTSTKC